MALDQIRVDDLVWNQGKQAFKISSSVRAGSGREPDSYRATAEITFTLQGQDFIINSTPSHLPGDSGSGSQPGTWLPLDAKLAPWDRIVGGQPYTGKVNTTTTAKLEQYAQGEWHLVHTSEEFSKTVTVS